MRLLLDANLAPRIANALQAAGFDVAHVADLNMLAAADDEIFERAVKDGFTVITADSDFGALLAVRRATSPSVIQLRHVAELTPEDHAALLVANLRKLKDDLERGAIVSLSPTRLAVRNLPIR